MPRFFAIAFFTLFFIACVSTKTTPTNTKSVYIDINSFESCLIKGGDVMESYPRQCSFGEQFFVEDISAGKQGDKKTILFEIAPETTICQGLHPVDQSCLIVNGGLFYDSIEGYVHQSGVGSVIEVERTQICDPEVFNSCPQDVSIYTYKLLRVMTGSVIDTRAKTFVGEIIPIKDGKDGSMVQLKNKHSNNVLYAVISIPNLGPSTEFDFTTLKIGNMVKVTGEVFRLGQKTQMAANHAIGYVPVYFTDIKATPEKKVLEPAQSEQ